MTTASPPDMVGDPKVAAPTTLRVNRVTRLAAQFPDDHKIRPSDGKLFLTADAHEKLGNADTVRAMAAHGMDLASTWERFRHAVFSLTPATSWKSYLVDTGNSNGIEHQKDTVVRTMISVPKNAVGALQVRFIVWNKELVSSLTDTIIDDITSDYSVNRRDRIYPYGASADNGRILEFETRFKGIVLHPDNSYAIAYSVAPGSGGTIKVSFITTGHSREMDKGGF